MSRHDPIAEKVLHIAEPAVIAAGYELVDVKFTMEQGGWVLRVYIDRPPPETTSVDLNDCERISRELSALLDVEDPIPHNYSLEVSSPGIDRPLRTVEHFRRYLGSEAKVALEPPLRLDDGSERRNFRGVLASVEDDHVIVAVDGRPFRLPIRDIEQARLVPDWDAVLGAKPAPKPGKPKKSKSARS
jgi:ribosome maturation factor RimP